MDNSGTHGGVAWTIKAQSAMKTYNDTIIDDIDYNHGFYMYNQPPSHQRYFRDDKAGGYNGHYWYTYSEAGNDVCYVKWTPTLPSTGNYEVFAYVPDSFADATNVKYRIYYNGGSTKVTVNQSTHHYLLFPQHSNFYFPC